MEKNMALCKGRHSIPKAVDGAVFENTLNPLELQQMENTAKEVLQGVTKLNLYVTGLTVALVAVINVCHISKIKLVLWHYDKDSGCYYPQFVY